MRVPLLYACLAAALHLAHAAAAPGETCAPLRFGYTDKSVPPYYLGSGPLEHDPPGALAQLARDAGAAASCRVDMVRMPPARLHMSLDNGAIDATSLFSPDLIGSRPDIVYPLGADGKPDPTRGTPLFIVVFVRAADKLPANGDTLALLRGRTLGLSQGAPHLKYLKARGLTVDDGAATPDLNFEKLKLGRIDGFAIALFAAGDMDDDIRTRFAGQFVRLDKPLMMSHSWLALNRSWYLQNRRQAEAIWRWYGAHGPARFAELLHQYRR